MVSTAQENSDVLSPGLVAVAVTVSPLTVAADSVTSKLARPDGSVLTLADPSHRWPSPNPEGSAWALA